MKFMTPLGIKLRKMADEVRSGFEVCDMRNWKPEWVIQARDLCLHLDELTLKAERLGTALEDAQQEQPEDVVKRRWSEEAKMRLKRKRAGQKAAETRRARRMRQRLQGDQGSVLDLTEDEQVAH